jgi:hypothetical protein
MTMEENTSTENSQREAANIVLNIPVEEIIFKNTGKNKKRKEKIIENFSPFKGKLRCYRQDENGRLLITIRQSTFSDKGRDVKGNTLRFKNRFVLVNKESFDTAIGMKIVKRIVEITTSSLKTIN